MHGRNWISAFQKTFRPKYTIFRNTNAESRNDTKIQILEIYVFFSFSSFLFFIVILERTEKFSQFLIWACPLSLLKLVLQLCEPANSYVEQRLWYRNPMHIEFDCFIRSTFCLSQISQFNSARVSICKFTHLHSFRKTSVH